MTKSDERVFNQAEVNELVGKARVEARERSEKEFETKFANDKRDAEVTRLAEQEDWKALADERGKQLTELDSYKGQAEQYAVTIQAVLDSMLEELGEDAKKAVKAMPGNVTEKLDWLTANKGLFNNVGDGVGSSAPIKDKKKREQKLSRKLFPTL